MPVSVVIVAKTEACGKLFKMCEALVYSYFCRVWACVGNVGAGDEKLRG